MITYNLTTKYIAPNSYCKHNLHVWHCIQTQTEGHEVHGNKLMKKK